MTPDEVCEALASIGADVSRRTLLHYEEAGLIPKPERGGGGKNGRFSNYPEWTVEEAFTAWSFIHGKYGYGESFFTNRTPESFFGDKNPKIAPSTVKIFRDNYYSKEENNLISGNFRETEEYQLSVIEDEKNAKENAYEHKKYLAGRELVEEDKEINRSHVLRMHAKMYVSIGFGVLWQSERLRARELLSK